MFNNSNVDSTVQESTGAPKTGVDVKVYRETTVGDANGNEKPKAVVALFERLNPFVSKSIIKSFSYFSGHLKYALIHGFDNLGFGLGLQNFDDYVYKHYPSIVGYGSHSNFITFLGDTGIWGFLAQVFLQFIIIIMGFKTIINNPNDRLPAILLSTYLGLLITGIIRTYYLDTYTFIVMGMIYKICYLKTKKIKIENNLLSWKF